MVPRPIPVTYIYLLPECHSFGGFKSIRHLFVNINTWEWEPFIKSFMVAKYCLQVVIIFHVVVVVVVVVAIVDVGVYVVIHGVTVVVVVVVVVRNERIASGCCASGAHLCFSRLF